MKTGASKEVERETSGLKATVALHGGGRQRVIKNLEPNEFNEFVGFNEIDVQIARRGAVDMNGNGKECRKERGIPQCSGRGERANIDISLHLVASSLSFLPSYFLALLSLSLSSGLTSWLFFLSLFPLVLLPGSSFSLSLSLSLPLCTSVHLGQGPGRGEGTLTRG